MWPILNMFRIMAYEEQKSPSGSKPHSPPVAAHWSVEIFVRYLRQITYVAFALVSYLYCFPLDRAIKAPLFSGHLFPLETSWLGWVLIVFTRNFTVEILTYGFWHYFLYESGFAKNFRRADGTKFNPKMPDAEQLARERLYTTLGFCMSSLYEVFMINQWATGLPCLSDADLLKFPLYSLFHFALVPYLRDGHFYIVHRFMHPWRIKIFGVDPGKVIYRRAHSLHHKSVNTGPWSGLSMHPYEHFLYYTCTLVPLLFTVHPFHFLFNKFHADISPVPGHDGFEQPAGGSLIHYLHHSKFEVNYGTPLVPFDVWFGTYEDGSRWAKKDAKFENLDPLKDD